MFQGRPDIVRLEEQDRVAFRPAPAGLSNEGDIALPAPVEDLFHRGLSHPDNYIRPGRDND